MTNALFAFNHIFTQNEDSKRLLEQINYKNVTVSGDTRFDRVSNQLKTDNTLSFINEFKDDKLCVVLGSTWPDDDRLYIDYINTNSDSNLKFIIAPHHIKPNYINSLKSQLKISSICYSAMENENLSHYQVFILDTIGYLSKVYSYATISYVGGGAGTTGLHNILEPAVFGVPILIGRNYNKFPEAKTLIEKGGVISITNSEEFESTLNNLNKNSDERTRLGLINANFIEKNKGAVIQILAYIRI